jgi:hypothetical protein
MKAKRISDSILTARLGKSYAEKFYRFNSSESAFRCEPYKSKDRYPSDYTLTYDLLESPVPCQTSIILSSDFVIESVGHLIDSLYLKQFISKSKLKKSLKEMKSRKHAWVNIAYDSSAYEKQTYKPFIEVRHYVRSFTKDESQCLTNVDSCVALDLYNGKFLRWYYSESSACF